MTVIQRTDDDILVAIQETGDGILARRHLKEVFWADKSLRAMQKVMSRLYQRGLIQRTTIRYERIKEPPTEPVYWLGWRGILRYTERMGIEEPYQPKNDRENQMRILENKLRAEGIRWVRTPPSTGKLEHHFFVVDFRLKVQKDVDALPSVTMEWINESAFRSPKMDKVKFTIKDINGRLVERERGVCPDGFCLILDHDRKNRGEPYKLHSLVEVDLGTHSVSSSFASKKAAPYAAYIGSPAFRSRFGINAGDWLIITTGKRRMEHLIEQTQETAGEGARWFYFTSWDQLVKNVLTDPIWYKVGSVEPIALLA